MQSRQTDSLEGIPETSGRLEFQDAEEAPVMEEALSKEVPALVEVSKVEAGDAEDG